MYHLIPSNEPTSEGPASEPIYVSPEAEFHARLEAVTPAMVVTPTLIAINVLVFLAMIVNGVSGMQPPPDALIRWGANFGPNTLAGGQWWRLLTSTFLHIGIVHLGFNMYVLWQIGPFVERLLGNVGFLLVYLIAGFGGALASLAWNPYSVSAGASGAIFGLYGALLGFLLMSKHDSIPSEVLSTLSKSALIFIGYNVVFGFLRAGTDMAAHAGGLASGFLCGLVLSLPVTVSHKGQRLIRDGVVALGSAALLVGIAAALPRPVDLRTELLKFGTVEKKTLTTYNAALTRARTEKLRDETVADAVEKEVLPDWMREHDVLKKVAVRLPEKQKQAVTSLVQYMEIRQEAWVVLAKGLRSHNAAMVQQASVKQQEADGFVKKMAAPAR